MPNKSAKRHFFTWGLGVLALLLGTLATWLALRADGG
jgi:hypothetical protein